MKIDYDPKFNVAYVKLSEKKDNVRTLSLSEDINVDICLDGKLYGFELLNANQPHYKNFLEALA